MPDLSPAVVWFRQDLRVADNPALAAAANAERPVVALYVLDEETGGTRAHGGATRWWLHHSLASLGAELEDRGVPLTLRQGRSADVLRDVIAETGAGAVYWNRCYEPWAVVRDTDIKEMLKRDGIETESFNGSLLLEPWKIETGQGGPYKVFTPFWKRLRELYRPPQVASLPDMPGAADAPVGDSLDDWGAAAHETGLGGRHARRLVCWRSCRARADGAVPQ